MNRRRFLYSLAAAAATSRLSAAPARITRIRLAPITGRFHKFVAMNSYDTAPKGHTYSNTLVRIETDQGVEGVGVLGYSAPSGAFVEAARALIGANPLELYEMAGGPISGRAAAHADLLARFRHLDGPLLDLVGKLTARPVWKLLGSSARDRVEAYDGTLYFSDVWFRDRGVRAVLEEAEEALKYGYRGLKLKAGRGSKWMEKDAGLRRDIEVVRATRRLAGPDVKIMVDPNDGYRSDYARAWQLISETAESKIHWIEEIFPENVEWYGRLREQMNGAGIGTLIADGEGMQQPAQFGPYLKPKRLIDVMQLDIRTAGFVDNLLLARAGDASGAVSVPHNWGSQVGVLMGLQIGRAAPNIPAAEDDRSTCDVIIAEGYEFKNGFYTVPDTPGLSIRVNERVYADKCRAAETVIS